MRSDHEILEALGRQLSQAERAAVVARLLRVPQAWAFLRDPHNLEQLSASSNLTAVTPADLAMQCLGWSEVPDDLTLAPSLQPRAESLWPETGGALSPAADLQAVALLAVGLLRLGRSGGPEAVADWVLENPAAWLSPLACALPHLPDQAAVLRALVARGFSTGLRVAGQSLLALTDPRRAAQDLLTAAPDCVGHLLASLDHSGEAALAQAVGQALAERQDGKGAAPSDGSLTDLTRHAITLRLQGRTADAFRTLGQAWEVAADSTADVADQMAEVAELEGDAVTALEARQQAVRSRPTSLRRAALAKALADTSQEQAALGVLTDPPTSTEEQIAAGYALSHMGEASRAAGVLQAAWDAIASSQQSVSSPWLAHLSQALHAAGQVAAALQSYSRLLDANPTDTHARLAYASLLREAGDPHASVQQAAIVLGLAPEFAGARTLLASSLQAAGHLNEARTHWQALIQDEPSAAFHAAACALEAGETQNAIEACRAQLQSDPNSLEIKVLLARALAAQGAQDEATAALAEIVEQSPEAAPAWIALAEICETAGDAQSAETTLRRAAQTLPDRAAVHAAWGDLLRRLGRPGEALRPTLTAATLEPSNARWALALGDLHRSLGNLDEAQPYLQSAVARRPRDLTARVALASAMEQAGRLDEAAALVGDIPSTASADALRVAGRILVRSARSQARSDLAERGLMCLEQALQLLPGDRVDAFWQGQALELLGRSAEALEAYRVAQQAMDTDDALRLPALVGIARTALALGDAALARATLETAREEHPASAELLTALAQTLLADRQPEAAVQAAEQASLLDPSSQDALRLLRQAALETDRTELALRALQRLVALRPGDSQAWMDLAESALQTADPAMARTALSRALLAGRQVPTLLRRAASVYRRMDAAKRAQRALRRAVRLDPQDAVSVRQLAQTSELVGDGEAAVQAWLTAAALEPGNAEPFVRAARALEGLSRWNAACDVWQKAVELQPESAAAQGGLARAYLGAGQTRRTLDAYSRAVALDPADADLLHEAGLACLALDAHAEAADLLEKAAFLAPERAAIATSLAESLFQLGRAGDCRTALDQAATRAPLSARGLALRALCLVEEGDLPAAIDSFEKACSTQGPGADDARWLAKAGLRLGRWQEAERALRSALNAGAALPDLHLALIQTRLQSVTVGWILSQVEAHTHASRAGLPQADVIDSIAADLSHFDALANTESAGQPVRQLLQALRGEATASDLEALAGAAMGSLDDGLALPVAVALLRASQPLQALGLLQALASRRGTSPLAALLLGLSLSLQGRSADARVPVETARLDPVLRPAADALAARTWLIEQVMDQAIAALNAAVAAWPEESVWHEQLASLYLQTDEVAAAIPHLQQALEANPSNADAALTLARALRQNGQLPEALQSFSQAVRLFPDQTRVWQEAGEVALEVGDPEQAEDWFERACTLAPSDGHSLIGAARAALARGKTRQATERAQSAARLSPSDADVLLGLGEILEKQGKAGEALQAYDKALANASDTIPVQLFKGRLLVRLGRAQEAADDLRRVLTESSSNDRAWAALAEISEATQDLDTALRAAANAVRIAPRNPAYHHTLGRLARRSGHLDRALDELHRAETLGAAGAALLIEIGRVHEDRREHALALDAYERAIATEPQSAEAHFLAGVTLKRLKAYARAGRMLKKAVDLNPKDPEAHHQLAAVRALELVHGGLQQATVHP